MRNGAQMRAQLVAPNAPRPIPSQAEYASASFWHATFNRTAAEAHLAPLAPGAFVLRPSSQLGCLSLSHKKRDGTVGHALVHMHTGQVSFYIIIIIIIIIVVVVVCLFVYLFA